MLGLDTYVGDGFGYGDLFSSLFKTAGSVTEGVATYQKGEATASASANAIYKATQDAIIADTAATAAIAKAAMSLDLAKTNPKLAAQSQRDQSAAKVADAAQDKAGAVAGVDKTQRAAAAQKAVDNAKNDFVRLAAQRTLDKINGHEVAAADAPVEPSALQKTLIGPVKVWHAIVGAVALGGGALLLSKGKAS